MITMKVTQDPIYSTNQDNISLFAELKILCSTQNNMNIELYTES